MEFRGSRTPLISDVLPQLDRYQAMKLNDCFIKFKKNEISEVGFRRLMTSIVGDQNIQMVVHQLESQEEIVRSVENAPYRSALQSQVLVQQENLPNPSAGFSKHGECFRSICNAVTIFKATTIFVNSPHVLPDLDGMQLVQLEQEREPSAFPAPGFNKLDMQFVHPLIPTCESAGGIQRQPNKTDFRSKAFDQTARQSQVSMRKQYLSTPNPVLPDLDGVQLVQLEQERDPSAFIILGLNKLQPQPQPHMQFVPALIPTCESTGGIQRQPDKMLSSNMPTATSSKTPAKKPKVCKKKSLYDPVPAKKPKVRKTSKKQKVSGTFSDPSIEQLNDVTSVSGVNLREEEEQLFSNPKRDSLVSEASQHIVQEGKDMLILEKIPFQQKLKKILLSKCGLKGFSNDVQPCLSLCLEERMRGLIGDLIRLSKHRLDVSDSGNEIMLLNRKAQDEWKTKQAEGEKLQKPNECTATNVAARESLGGDDILSKWQLMAEIAKQKCGGTNSGSGPQPGKDIGRKMNTPQDGTKKGGRTQGFDVLPRTISVKDVIAALEREPQMSKSTLILKLYEKLPSDAATAT